LRAPSIFSIGLLAVLNEVATRAFTPFRIGFARHCY
jgi:hypothetical protein